MDDEPNTGIPTRAIHEAYLDMQAAHRAYRRARDNGEDTHAQQGDFQDTVLTFYELVRPHLRHETSLEDYWTGHLPSYSGWDFESAIEAAAYLKEQGTGVYQIQEHLDVVEIDNELLTDGGVGSWDEWHDILELSWESERLVAARPEDKPGLYIVKLLRAAVLPLRELDNWQAHIIREHTRGSGFMAGESTVETRREYQPPQKIVTAKRLLVEAADKLGALSEFEASTQRTEITREDMEKVEQWRQEKLD